MSSRDTARRVVKWTVVAGAMFIVLFLFGPSVVRVACRAATKESDIDALKKRYWTLAATDSPRRFAVSAWLKARGVSVDPGIRDEAIEHASLPVAIFGVTRWQWQDLFLYWSRPAAERTPEALLSDATAE